MLFRVVTTSTNYPANKTMVIVELLEQIGVIVKIVEKLQFEVPKALDSGSAELLHNVGKILNDAGFAVPIPPMPEEKVKDDLPDFPAESSPEPQ